MCAVVGGRWRRALFRCARSASAWRRRRVWRRHGSSPPAGEILREARERADLTQEEAADQIERHATTLHKIEKGTAGVRIRPKQDIEGLCALYGITDRDTVDSLKALVEVTKIKGPFQPHRDVLSSNEFDLYLSYERDAASMSTYEANLVPGLLQTQAYARQLTRVPTGGGTPRDEREVDKRVQLRMERQSVLRRTSDPLQLDVILDETVLRRPIGDPQLLADQFRHINDVGELPNVTVRVAPYDAGLHQGVISCQFIILRFFIDIPPVVYSDAFVGDNYFKDEEDISRYEDAFTNISGVRRPEVDRQNTHRRHHSFSHCSCGRRWCAVPAESPPGAGGPAR